MLPDLPEIPLNTAKTKPVNSLPELPNYGKEIPKITITEVNDDMYSQPIHAMEKSVYNQQNEIKLISPPIKTTQTTNIEKNYIKKDNEIFVKIKKFESAISSFDDINQKINEMQQDIDKAKRIIEDETRELEEWEKELTKMKKSLDTIDRNLFSEIEK